MSAICVVIRFDGARVDRERFERMTAASAYRGPDGIGHWIEGHVGLAHLALHTTTEARRERQPLIHAAGHLVLVADARVDNRRELIGTLTAQRDSTEPEPTDADLILAAYERWGDDCPRHLIGDYAFAVWDRSRRRLFCARDALGIRVLHYYQRGSDLIIATTPESIIAWLGERPPVNDAFLQGLVARDFQRGINESAYQDIFRLPPAFVLEARDGRLSRSRYWTLGAQPPPPCRSETDYIEAFRELFEQAVTACLRSADPVGLQVSGGLDSSSIACVVDRLIGKGKIEPLPVRMYSATFATTPYADEREYMQAVAAHCQHVPSTRIPSDDCWGLKAYGTDSSRHWRNGPVLSALTALDQRILATMRADGTRAVLSGVCADQVLLGSAYHNPTLLGALPWRRIPSELPHFVRYSRLPASEILARAFVQPWLPKAFIALLRRWRKPGAGAQPCVSGGAVAAPLPPPPLRGRVSASIYQQLYPHCSGLIVTMDDQVAQFGLEMRLPFLDRRLVEFLLAAPPELFFRGGYVKYLLREALAGILVEKVRGRTAITHFSGLVAKGLRENERSKVESLIEASRVARRGYVSQCQLEQSWVSFCSGGKDASTLSLMSFLGVEAWLRSLE